MKTLMDLISSSHKEEGGVVFDDILKEASDAVIQETRELAVKLCSKMIKSNKAILDMCVKRLREVRVQEKILVAKIKDLDHAFRYFAATGIPFPMLYASGGSYNLETDEFCRKLNIAVPGVDSELWKVPADWKPAA